MKNFKPFKWIFPEKQEKITTMKNLKEFKTLIERYETIGIEEIRKAWKKGKAKHNSTHFIAQSLTGFGGNGHCTLCLAIDSHCEDCVYNLYSDDHSFHCINTLNLPTYEGINHAKTPTELLKGYRTRAEHMKTTYKEIL